MFTQYQLPYANNALEPVIDELTVATHHGKHHAAYTAGLNAAAEKAGVADMPIEELLASLDKIEHEALRKAIKNQGGGYYNHNLYFSTIGPLLQQVSLVQDGHGSAPMQAVSFSYLTHLIRTIRSAREPVISLSLPSMSGSMLII